VYSPKTTQQITRSDNALAATTGTALFIQSSFDFKDYTLVFVTHSGAFLFPDAKGVP
jgi:hypothetical protein